MSEPETERGDFVIILSSDLIASVMSRYFNDQMFMMPVHVVDLESSGGGYAFTLAFTGDTDIQRVDMQDECYTHIAKTMDNTTLHDVIDNSMTIQREVNATMQEIRLPKRGSGGRFTKGVNTQESGNE